jgi:two-component system response regulator HydG
LRVPNLRDRPEDILPIATHLLFLKEEESGLNSQGFSPRAEDALKAHSWPGNVRELGNAIERACIECSGSLIEPEHLGLCKAVETSEASEAADTDLNIKNMEERLIRRALHTTGGNRSRSALLLGVNRATLYNKLRVYEIA